jgi:hypothetical protein
MIQTRLHLWNHKVFSGGKKLPSYLAKTLQERGKKPTAEPYADGQMSLPSA